MPKTHGNMIILTGARESGKTSLLLAGLEEFWDRGLDCAGVLSPAVFTNGKKTGIDLLDVRSGECLRLANLRQSDSTGIMTDRWVFESQTLDWGNRVLDSATPCMLLFVDELGPIEFEKCLGLQSGISALNSGGYEAAVVVIRPELLERAQQLWPGALVFDLEVHKKAAQKDLIQTLSNHLKK
jgi:nucleoside-triphosphatase THEP1